ncbi:MAG: hypothetical protein ACYTBJ_22060 [Planctomycetota bacterium]|jgi:hypothetical protein
MANYFVDSTTGSDSDDGTTMDLAWATVEKALETGGLSAGDRVWVRRIHSETPASNIECAYDGTPVAPIYIIGWPRAADASISSATWTNGSTTVDLIVGLSMDREKHVGRWITAPDGNDYLITKITDANTILVDNEYTGATVTGTDGASTIVADDDWYDDMGTQFSFDDSAWTIKESDWDADADDLPNVDFRATAFYLNISSDTHHSFRNLWWQQGTSLGINLIYGKVTEFVGNLFDQASTQAMLTISDQTAIMDRCIWDCDPAAGGGSRSITVGRGMAHVRNSASYGGDGEFIIFRGGIAYLERVNVGVEETTDGWWYFQYGPCEIYGRDVKFGTPDVTDITVTAGSPQCSVRIENWGKVLGAHYEWTPQGTRIKTDVVAGSGDPYKRTGGADSVIEVLHDLSSTANLNPNPIIEYAMVPVFTHEFEATTDTKDYRYYVQAEGVVTATELWIECEYVSAHDDSSEYVIKKVVSDEAFTARADAEDWAEYMEVTGITPAVGSKVRIQCYCSYYHATNKIYIDPKVVITDG